MRPAAAGREAGGVDRRLFVGGETALGPHQPDDVPVGRGLAPQRRRAGRTDEAAWCLAAGGEEVRQLAGREHRGQPGAIALTRSAADDALPALGAFALRPGARRPQRSERRDADLGAVFENPLQTGQARHGEREHELHPVPRLVVDPLDLAMHRIPRDGLHHGLGGAALTVPEAHPVAGPAPQNAGEVVGHFARQRARPGRRQGRHEVAVRHALVL